MIISITGSEGAGKTTVANMLSEQLGYDNYYIGDLRRKAAATRGMTLDEYNKYGLTNSSTDTEVDDYAKKLGESQDDFVIQGRTMWYFIPHSFKIFLSVAPEEGAERIVNHLKEGAERNETKYKTTKEAMKGLAERNRNDVERYKKHYGIENVHDPKHFDLMIDTTKVSPGDVVNKIIAALPGDDN